MKKHDILFITESGEEKIFNFDEFKYESEIFTYEWHPDEDLFAIWFDNGKYCSARMFETKGFVALEYFYMPTEDNLTEDELKAVRDFVKSFNEFKTTKGF